MNTEGTLTVKDLANEERVVSNMPIKEWKEAIAEHEEDKMFYE
jgi:hypothetical protein